MDFHVQKPPVEVKSLKMPHHSFSRFYFNQFHLCSPNCQVCLWMSLPRAGDALKRRILGYPNSSNFSRYITGNHTGSWIWMDMESYLHIELEVIHHRDTHVHSLMSLVFNFSQKKYYNCPSNQLGVQECHSSRPAKISTKP